MSKYKILEDMGLQIIPKKMLGSCHGSAIDADEVLKLVSNAVKVYGDNIPDAQWTTGQESSDRHSGLLINIQPLGKKVTRAEIDDYLKSGLSDHKFADGVKLLKRISEHGVES